MSAALSFAVVIVSLAGLGFAAGCVALAVRNGKLSGDNRVLVPDVARLRKALEEISTSLGDANKRAEELERDHERELKRIHDYIREKFGDSALGDLAVDDIERLLSPPQD